MTRGEDAVDSIESVVDLPALHDALDSAGPAARAADADDRDDASGTLMEASAAVVPALAAGGQGRDGGPGRGWRKRRAAATPILTCGSPSAVSTRGNKKRFASAQPAPSAPRALPTCCRCRRNPASGVAPPRTSVARTGAAGRPGAGKRHERPAR